MPHAACALRFTPNAQLSQVQDLLEPSKEDLPLRTDANKRIVIPGLTEQAHLSPGIVLSLHTVPPLLLYLSSRPSL